jgi:hypothetical protein
MPLRVRRTLLSAYKAPAVDGPFADVGLSSPAVASISHIASTSHVAPANPTALPLFPSGSAIEADTPATNVATGAEGGDPGLIHVPNMDA